MDLLERYKDEYLKFAEINDFNIEERAMRVPAEKHFWVTRMMEAKRDREILIKKKKKLKRALTEKMITEGVVSLNKKTLDDLENSEKFEDLNNQIQDYDLLVEYLELIVKNITFIGQDIKNIIALKELNE